ncbi:MAG: T9SS type A sorting domain-containing protein [Chloroflexota bacterium]
MKRFLLFAALFALSIAGAFAQKTGLYTEKRMFHGENRDFAIYAPTDYSPDSTYRLMICLHGSGDTGTNFLGVLINSGQWQTLFPKTIFVCPDGGSDQASDFFWPLGDEAVVDEARTLVESIYPNINDKDVVLEGFSLGGRSALKLGLENPEKYKGLILHTPAIQGPKEVLDIDPFSLHYKWENASKIPITISVGTQDSYIYIIPKILPFLIKNGGVMNYWALNMQHTIPPNSITKEMMDFIYNPIIEGLDLHLTPFETEFYSYENSYALKLPFWNRGSEDVSKIKVKITPKNGGAPIEDVVTSEFKGYDYKEYETVPLALVAGVNEFTVAILEINDEVPTNSEITQPITFRVNYLTPKSLPLAQSFEGEDFPNDEWRVETSGSLLTWEVNKADAKDGASVIGILNWALTFDNQGLPESLISPLLKMNSVETPALRFAYQFNYHYFDETIVNGGLTLTDTLSITVSTDLGQTWNEVYRKSGEELATFDEPLLNPVQIDRAYYEPKKADWKYQIVDLKDYKNADKALVKISVISGVGGCLYMDDIRFDDLQVLGARELPEALSIAKLSPNPAVDATELSFALANGGATRVEVLDMKGSLAASYDAGTLNAGENTLKLNTSALAPGVYFVKVLRGAETITAKLNVIGR